MPGSGTTAVRLTSLASLHIASTVPSIAGAVAVLYERSSLELVDVAGATTCAFLVQEAKISAKKTNRKMDFDIVNKTICLCAKRNSGKSQLMRYIIMMSKYQFKKVFVICPTEQINRFYQGLVDEKNIFESYNEEWIQKLMKELSKANDGKQDKDASHILLILDDCCSDTNFHQSKTFKQLFTKGRH